MSLKLTCTKKLDLNSSHLLREACLHELFAKVGLQCALIALLPIKIARTWT